MAPAPITLFTFNRPWHTRRTVEALLDNAGAADSDLIIYADGARSEKDAEALAEVRAYLQTISGFKSVRLIERDKNWGLAASIIEGVTDTVTQYGRVIVVEDDLVTSPHFLTYMNAALDKFEAIDEVISVHGYCYPVEAELPEAFCLPGADCWGWATWARGWSLFNEDGAALLQALETDGLVDAFDYDGSFPYSKMLKNQIAGKNNSWAIRWYASAFLAGKLTLYPGQSLVHNIGNDDSGTHAAGTHSYDVSLAQSPIDLSETEASASAQARAAFIDYFRQTHRGPVERLLARLRAYVRRA